jgi:hypothetical protein
MDKAATPSAPTAPSVFDRVFDLSKSGSSVRTELVAGLTTFLTMVIAGAPADGRASK